VASFSSRWIDAQSSLEHSAFSSPVGPHPLAIVVNVHESTAALGIASSRSE
jgi:hypothetical protein